MLPKESEVAAKQGQARGSLDENVGGPDVGIPSGNVDSNSDKSPCPTLQGSPAAWTNSRTKVDSSKTGLGNVKECNWGPSRIPNNPVNAWKQDGGQWTRAVDGLPYFVVE